MKHKAQFEIGEIVLHYGDHPAIIIRDESVRLGDGEIYEQYLIEYCRKGELGNFLYAHAPTLKKPDFESMEFKYAMLPRYEPPPPEFKEWLENKNDTK